MRIAVLDDYQRVAERMADWHALDPEVVFFDRPFATADEAVRQLAEFEVVVAMRERTPFPAQVLDRLPRLQLLVSTGSWNAAIDVEHANRRGVVVCGTGGVVSATPELTWGMILALARSIPAEDANMRTGGWQTTVGRDLAGATLGLIGLGHVGSRVAAVGLAFGMRVLAWSHGLTDDRAAAAGSTRVELVELLERSDVLSIHTRLSERTHGLIGPAELARMKPGAMLVNTSRGPIVDESALIEALESGHLGGAALDVYATEPLPKDSPLRSVRNTVLTPHLGFVSEATYRRFYEDAVEDIAQFLAGSPVRVMTTAT